MDPCSFATLTSEASRSGEHPHQRNCQWRARADPAGKNATRRWHSSRPTDHRQDLSVTTRCSNASAQRSAIMIVVMFVGAETIVGMIEASATVRPST